MFSFLTDAGLQGSPQKPCQAVRQRGTGRAGFTLPELLAVIVIIGILAAMVGGGVITAQKIARQTHCKSSLKQFGVAIQTYRAENQMKNPGWLSNLYPYYIDSKSLYICRSDEYKGKRQSRPEKMLTKENIPSDKFFEVTDNESNNTDRERWGANMDIQLCSYFYEFSQAPNLRRWHEGHWPVNADSSWMRFTTVSYTDWTWCDYKESQLRFGDSLSKEKLTDPPLPYSESLLPIIRCYHHWAETSVERRHDNWATGNRTFMRSPITLNVAYAGNVYVGPLQWELTVQPGDRQ